MSEDVEVSLSMTRWKLVIAAIDAAQSAIAHDIRLTRPSMAGVQALIVVGDEYAEIRKLIVTAIGGTEAA